MFRSLAFRVVTALGLSIAIALLTSGPGRAQATPGETARIVGGEPSKSGAFPAVVAMMVSGRLACGGTLIGKNWVLTAGHCVKSPSGVIRNAADLTVLPGGVKLTSKGGRIAVKQVLPHPNYDPSTMTNDIALLELAQGADQSRQLLASSGVSGKLVQPGASATVTGWGRTAQSGDTSTSLLQVSVPIVSHEQCMKAYSESKPGKINDHNICAGLDAGGKDACQGDSGGPLYVTLPASGPVQVGIVSWGEGCAQPKKYGIYTAVADFEPFLREHVPDVSFATQDPPAGENGPLAAVAAAQPAALPPPGITRQVSLDVVPTGSVKLGNTITLNVRSTDPGPLLIYSRDSGGKVTQLFPNQFLATTGKDIAADVVTQIPKPEDRFTITATRPVGETEIVAIVTPPGAKVADLASLHVGLETITDAATFFAELSKRLTNARMAEPPQRMPRGFEIQEKGGPPIATAVRKVLIVE
jgi:secreted trypsin-like serine protease